MGGMVNLILVGSHAEGSHCWALVSSLALLAIVDRGQEGAALSLMPEAWKKERFNGHQSLKHCPEWTCHWCHHLGFFLL
jgi:hypothetical protein